MVWVILFIPLALWLSVAFASQFTWATLAIVFVVILIFCIVEFTQLSRDHTRSKAPLMIMCLILASLVGSLIFR